MSEPRYRLYLCGGPNCTPRGVGALRAVIECALRERQLDAAVEVQVSGCQDHCDYGPNLMVFPGPYRYAQLTPERLRTIIERHLAADQPVATYLARPHMRRG